MQWKRIPDAARDWCGGVAPKTVYAAVKAGKLRVARIGAGRNMLTCEAWCDEWLTASAAACGPERFVAHIGGRTA